MIDEFEGTIIAEKYRIESHLRDTDLGGFYRGWHLLMEKHVTVKILSPALAIDQRFVDRFLAEAKNAARVTHTDVLNVNDFGTDRGGTTYAVYEEASGETLKSLIKRDAPLPLRQALNIAKHAAAGLAAAHARDLWHGGLSPEKILVSNEGETETVKVFDFGSQPVGRNAKRTDLEYLSPEQYNDVTTFDGRSDIYSLGVVLYEMLAGIVPFIGESVEEIGLKHETEPPPPLSAFRSDLPADLEPMILSAISIDPERRYQTMKAFAEDLELLSGGITVPDKAIAAAAPRKNIWQTAFIVLAGISLLAVVLIYATSIKKTDPTAQLQVDAGSLPVQPVGPATGMLEERAVKLGVPTEAELLSNTNIANSVDMLPGGDGYDAYANGVAPPPGAPQYVPPGGPAISVGSDSSPFMRDEGSSSVEIVQYTIDPATGQCLRLPAREVMTCPPGAPIPGGGKPNSASNSTGGKPPVQPPPTPAPTQKQFLAPTKTDKPTTSQPDKDKPAPAGKAGKGKPKDSE